MDAPKVVDTAVVLDWTKAGEARDAVFGAVLTRLSYEFIPEHPPSRPQRVSVQVTAGRRAGALAWPRPGRGWRMVVQAAVLDEPAEVQRFIAAHEYAHIYLCHRPWRGEVTAMACRLAFLVAGLTAILRTRAVEDVGHGDAGLFLAIFTWSLIGAVVAGQAVAAACRRPLERAADEQAGRWGYPLTAAVGLPMMAAEPPVARRWWFAPFRTHPAIGERIRLSQACVSSAQQGHSRR